MLEALADSSAAYGVDARSSTGEETFRIESPSLFDLALVLVHPLNR
jgi:hypothetical protein